MSNVSDAQKMVLWMRKNAIAWNTLTVGTITIDGTDLKLNESLPKPKIEVVDRQNIQRRYGGDLLKEAADSEGMNSVVEMEDHE